MVGDGEISFGGGQDVTSLMNALEGAAVNAATGSTKGATQNVASAPVAATSSAPVDESGIVAAQSNPSPVVETPKAPKAPEVSEASIAPTTNVDPNLEQQGELLILSLP